MLSGMLKNNNVNSSKVNGLDENRSGCTKWLICVSTSTRTTDSEMRSNNKANMGEEMPTEMGNRPS